LGDLHLLSVLKSSPLAIPPLPPLKSVGKRVTLLALFLDAQTFTLCVTLCLLLLVCAALEQAGNKSHGKEKPRDWRCNTVRGLWVLTPEEDFG